MHEHTIAQKIIHDAQAHGNIKAITIEVGDLAHLPAPEMKEVMEKVTDWEVTVVSKAAIVACKCGFTGKPEILEHMHDHAVYKCPKCGEMMPSILDGHDIILKEVEVYE